MGIEIQKKRNIRNIRSFVCRNNRLSKLQKKSIDLFWDDLVINFRERKELNFRKIFGRIAPVILEIGFGSGKSLVKTAKKHSEKNFLGIEVYLPGIGTCLSYINKLKIRNLFIINHDAIEVLENMIPDHSLETIQLFFPDPWQKRRHHKRRIIQSKFIDLIDKKLLLNGIFHMMTDWEPYAKYTHKIMSSYSNFYDLSSFVDLISSNIYKTSTKFEKIGKKLGHSICDLIFFKIK